MPHCIVIGGGPAGSVGAILLRRAGWRVTLIEQNRFPRDKVCGECLSSLGVSVLRRCRLLARLEAAGAVWMTRARVAGDGGVGAGRAQQMRSAGGRLDGKISNGKGNGGRNGNANNECRNGNGGRSGNHSHGGNDDRNLRDDRDCTDGRTRSRRSSIAADPADDRGKRGSAGVSGDIVYPLPRPMLGIGRGPMDLILLTAAAEAGVDVRQPSRCEKIDARPARPNPSPRSNPPPCSNPSPRSNPAPRSNRPSPPNSPPRTPRESRTPRADQTTRDCTATRPTTATTPTPAIEAITASETTHTTPGPAPCVAGPARSVVDRAAPPAAPAAAAPAAVTVTCRDLTTNAVAAIGCDIVLLADGRGAAGWQRPGPTGDLGVKCHFRDVTGADPAAVTLFPLAGCYGGLAPIEDGLWNVALAVPARLVRGQTHLNTTIDALLRTTPAARRLLAGARRVTDYLASPLPRFAPRRDWPRGVVPVGNAAGAIEPIGGEGMGLALRSAELAAGAIINAYAALAEAQRLNAYADITDAADPSDCRALADPPHAGEESHASEESRAGDALPASDALQTGDSLQTGGASDPDDPSRPADSPHPAAYPNWVDFPDFTPLRRAYSRLWRSRALACRSAAFIVASPRLRPAATAILRHHPRLLALGAGLMGKR